MIMDLGEPTIFLLMKRNIYRLKLKLKMVKSSVWKLLFDLEIIWPIHETEWEKEKKKKKHKISTNRSFAFCLYFRIYFYTHFKIPMDICLMKSFVLPNFSFKLSFIYLDFFLRLFFFLLFRVGCRIFDFNLTFSICKQIDDFLIVIKIETSVLINKILFAQILNNMNKFTCFFFLFGLSIT